MGRLLVALIIILPLILWTLGCGKKGPPVPPSNRAQAVAGVSH
jgi:predicted small lipoprotein YifL